MSRHSLEAIQPEHDGPAERQLTRGSDFYLDQARRADQLSHATNYAGGQGAVLAQQLRNRASEAPDSFAVSLNGDPMSVEDERSAREAIDDLITHASHFLDTDPRVSAPGLNMLLNDAMPIDSSVTATVMNEAEAIFQAEPIDENAGTYRTAIDGLTMNYDYSIESDGKKYVSVRLERGPRTSPISEKHPALPSDSDVERMGRVARIRQAIRGLRGTKPRGKAAESIETTNDGGSSGQDDTNGEIVDGFGMPTRGKHHKRNPEMDHSTGSYFVDLARQISNISARNIDSEALISNIEKRAEHSSEQFLPGQEPNAEHQVRLGVEEVIRLTAGFIAPAYATQRESARRLLRVTQENTFDESDPVTRPDTATKRILGELEELVGAGEGVAGRVVQNGQRVDVLTRPTMFDGVYLRYRRIHSSNGRAGGLEVWLQRMPPTS
jgi:hypothetical protein